MGEYRGGFPFWPGLGAQPPDAESGARPRRAVSEEGGTTKSLISEAIEITDAESLAPFEPWTRGFIDWSRGRITEPPSVNRTHEVSFHLTDHGMIYVLKYSTNPSGGPGYIYILAQATLGTTSTSGRELVSNVVEITLQGVIRSGCDGLHITSRKLDQDTVLEPSSVHHQAHQVHPAVQLTPALAQS